jgi:hypothetical protein
MRSKEALHGPMLARASNASFMTALKSTSHPPVRTSYVSQNDLTVSIPKVTISLHLYPHSFPSTHLDAGDVPPSVPKI